jgi:hypothetical protein
VLFGGRQATPKCHLSAICQQLLEDLCVRMRGNDTGSNSGVSAGRVQYGEDGLPHAGRPSGAPASSPRMYDRASRVRCANSGTRSCLCEHSPLRSLRSEARGPRAQHRLIEYPRRRCGWFVPSRHPDVWLTNRLPAVRGLASERGVSVRVSPWCGSKEARAPNPEIRHAHCGSYTPARGKGT